MALMDYTVLTREAAKMLGARIKLERRQRHYTLVELAERVGVSELTIRKIEKGDLTVAIGTVFETAVIVGVPLFHEDPIHRRFEMRHIEDRLAVLPKRIQKRPVNDDF
jgi:transcriptional regulator with XRE-family HTH domain